jgi:hypothetical protein
MVTGATHLVHDRNLATVVARHAGPGRLRETARAAGLPVFSLDIALYSMITFAIVISQQAVGNILVLAMLITPAACARLLTDRLGVMMVLAPAIGVFSCLTGLYLSYTFNLAFYTGRIPEVGSNCARLGHPGRSGDRARGGVSGLQRRHRLDPRPAAPAPDWRAVAAAPLCR